MDGYNGPWEFFVKLFMDGKSEFSCRVYAPISLDIDFYHYGLRLGIFSQETTGMYKGLVCLFFSFYRESKNGLK